MRRLAMLALCGALILSACRDESRESLTEPSVGEPEALLGSCQVTRFPIKDVTKLILIVFPAGKLRIEALVRAAAITFLWDTCKRAAAQKAAIVFIDRMNANSSRLRGTQDQQNSLKNLILNGVGIPGSVPSGNPGDFGVGFFSKNATEPLVVFTQSGVAGIELPPQSFDHDMIIRLSREPDAPPQLTDFDGNQFPPYWDYDATRSDGPTSPGDHVLNAGKLALIGFCLFLEPGGPVPDTGDEIPYPPENQRRIGHNPVPGSGQPAFEILDLFDGFAESEFGQQLAENCDELMPTPPVIGGFGNRSASLATAAWRSADGYLGRLARAVFLPEPLEAATLGKLPPPINGRAPSLSTFGVVEAPPPPDFGASGWSYHIQSVAPETNEWSTLPWPVTEEGWAQAPAPFGSVSFGEESPNLCDDQAPTDWPVNTVILLRRDFFVPVGTSSATISVKIDNDIRVFLNGIDVSDGTRTHEGCAEDSPLAPFIVSAGSESPLVPGAVNRLAVLGIDRGSESFVDVKVTLSD